MKARITFVCNMCGGSKVLLDAWAEWDLAIQEWVLSDTLTHAFCEDCDDETRLIEVELAEAPLPA